MGEFVETLRQARASRVAVLHEFWTQYDPSKRRVHMFCEGHDDVVFFARFLELCLPKGTKLYTYRCEGKARVFEAFSQITERKPGIRSVLFFVDKDLDDILGVPWPSDPRIFVTDVYSVENYLVTRGVLSKLYRDAARPARVAFQETTFLDYFETQLSRFHRSLLPVMAWILLARKSDSKPNLNNINLKELFRVEHDCRVSKASGARRKALETATGVVIPGNLYRRIAAHTRELARMPPKRIVRGKFEAWFFVEFWKRLLGRLRELAAEDGGAISVRITVEKNSLVATLARYVDAPRALELFLRAHFDEELPEGRETGAEVKGRKGLWLSRLVRGWWRGRNAK